MSKIFQIENHFCYWDATSVVPDLEYAASHYAPNIHFEIAPDYVFEGWGYDEFAEGDARFIKPTPPEGWLYDDETGRFYEEGQDPPTPEPSIRELEHENKLLKKENSLLKAQIQAQVDRSEFIEDCIAEMAMQVYSDV